MVIEKYLEEIYELAAEGFIEEATDLIFDGIDDLLCESSFLTVDEILQKVEVSKLPTTLMRSFLTITVAAKDLLPSRPKLYIEIWNKMEGIKGREKTQQILGGLS